MENTGQLFRFNIVGKTQITCGSLFTLLDSKKEELMINYYSIANSKMETILRAFIEDDRYNSQNACNVIANLDDQTTSKYRDDKIKESESENAYVLYLGKKETDFFLDNNV
jgi:DNA repair protein RadC